MLKVEDGFQRGRPELKSEVAHLQRCLIHLGYLLKPDCFFGPSTEKVIRKIQIIHGIADTGQVNSITWQAIERELWQVVSKQRSSSDSNKSHSEKKLGNYVNETTYPLTLTQFKGDLGWIHSQEGHAGKPYWPGGHSGVTLDPGYDLGYHEFEFTKDQYSHLLDKEQIFALKMLTGLTGRKAKSALNSSHLLLSIRITKIQAAKLFPIVIEPYWVAIVKRFPSLLAKDTLISIQTAFLSLAFNRGFNNRAFEKLRLPLEQSDWLCCSELIAQMQQNHDIIGIRLRRQREAKLITSELSK